nr:MAG: RNA dependent RNA polymerase [Leviviridae sp.]
MSKSKKDTPKGRSVTPTPSKKEVKKTPSNKTQKSRSEQARTLGQSPQKVGGGKSNAQSQKIAKGIFKDHPLQYISLDDARRLATIDAPSQSTNITIYTSENYQSYWLLCNTWLMQIAEISEMGAYDIRDVLLRKGLIPVITDCQRVANIILSENITLYESASSKEYILTLLGKYSIPSWLCGVLTGCENLQQVLQLLRYGKRFSPSQADIVRDKGTSDFLGVNNMCRLTRIRFAGQCACTRPDLLAKNLRPYILDMCKGFSVNYSRDGVFSNGVAADSSRPLADKLNAYATFVPFLDTPLYPLGYGGTIAPKQYGRREKYDIFFSEVRAVPKSYKTPRIIAMEDAYRQYHMQAIRKALEKSLQENGYEKYLTLHDQTGNRVSCNNGSIDGRYSTLDLSSASDSLSRTLVGLIFPSNVWREMNYFLPTHFKISVNGRVETRKMHMFCTSGSALTFPIESMVFLAILLYASDLAKLFYGEEMLPCRVFGDDMICDTRAFPIVLDILQRLGFIVNREKSFSDETSYRESCGVEYCGGYDTSTRYFPRATFDWKYPKSQLASLISLEKKFVSNWKIRRFMCDAVRTIFPKMTSSEVGSDRADLWEPTPLFEVGYAPSRTKRKASIRSSSANGVSEIMQLCMTREKHYSEVSKYGDNLKERLLPSGLTRLELVELWLYYKWLQTGPTFDDKLDEILRIPSANPNRMALSNVSKPEWILVQD